MYPSTLKMTKPATKLVMQLIVLSRNRRDQTYKSVAREGSPCEDGVLVAVVVELVVAGEGEQGPEPGPQREEDLGGGGYPDLQYIFNIFSVAIDILSSA